MLERSGLIGRLDGDLADVEAGAGRVVLVRGEAGIGKTALVEAWTRRHAAGVRLLRGVCDGSAVPRPLGPFLDAFPQLARVPAGPDRAALLACVIEGLAPGTDATAGGAGRPAVLVVEDVHWADEATLELLRSLAVRIDAVPALVIVTYRSDEVDPGHPLGLLVGDLAGRAAVRRYDVPPLTAGAVAELAAGARVELDPADLHRLTGGNAFHVTEVLAAGADAVPGPVRDAVRARVARLGPAARAALDVVAVAGLRAEPELLEAVLGDAASAVDEAVRRGVLLARDEGLQFRHDLARRAVEDDVPPMRRIALHRAVLRWLLTGAGAGARDPARTAYHAEQARDVAAAHEAATRAARASAAAGAHREAVLQYERTLRTAPEGDPGRVDLLEALSYELYLTGRIDDAIAIRAQVLQLHQAAGDRMRIAASHRWMSRLHWFGAHGPASVEHGRRAAELLRPQDRSAEAAMVLSNLAQLAMLRDDAEGARRWGHQAVELARAAGADDVAVHALINLASVGGAPDEAGPRVPALADVLDLALAGGMHEHAARAYCNLVSTALSERDLTLAEHWSRPGLAFCRDRDLDSWGVYLGGLLALLRLHQGRFEQARQAADGVLRRRDVPAVNRVNALLALGTVQARTGDPEAAATLGAALAIAEGSGEPQRLGPAVSALAELAWLRGDPWPERLDAVHALARDGWPWYRGELACWLARAGRAPSAADLPLPHALQLAGRWPEAAAAWEAAGSPYEQALALGESEDAADVTRALRILTDLGATAAASRLAPRAAALGGRVARPRLAPTRAHPAGLTARQAEVLRLLALGASNLDVAARLGISARTAEHHVSAVLAKLAVTTRREAVALAVDRGWVDLGTPPA